MMKRLCYFFIVLILSTQFLLAQNNSSSHQRLEQQAPNKEFHMINLNLNLHFNLTKKEVLGVATETIVPLRENYNTVHLEASDMKINKIEFDNANVPFKYDGKILSIELGKNYGLYDTLIYSIIYSAIPNKGIFFVLPDSAYPKRTPQLWSQSESEDAHYWYPCHDYPDDFGTSSLTATVPQNWVVVSNGLLKKETTDKKDKTKTFTWVEDKPHVVYLNSIVAGEFKIVKDKWDDVPIYYYVLPKYAKNAKENFSHTPDILKYFSEVTGHHYEWQKLSLSTVTNFTEGGMENVSAITLTDNTLHSLNAEPQITSTDLVSHETAHQWFGDLLTCRSWANAWLNEGFATFFEALYGKHAFGNDHFNFEMTKDHNQVINADKFERRPTVWNGYKSPEDVFGVYIYPRGASILNMMREMLGDDLFFKAIKYYVKKFQFHNVDTHDFTDAVREATGENLDWFYNEWLYKGGHPVYDVNYNYDEANHKLILNVDQTQKVDSLTPVYKMPVNIYIATAGQKINKMIWVDSLKNSYSFDLTEKPVMVNFDEGHSLLAEINFKKSADELSYQLKNDPDVSGRVWAAKQLSMQDEKDAVPSLIKSAKNDKFWGVREACISALGMFHSSGVRDELIVAVNDKDKRVDVDAINQLANFKNDKNISGLLKKTFDDEKNYFIRAAAITSLASVDSTNAIPYIDKAFKINSHQETVRAAALQALIKVDPKKGFIEAQKYLQYGQPDPLRIRALVSLAMSKDNKEKSLQIIRESLTDSYWIVRLIAVNELGRLGNQSDIITLNSVAKNANNNFILRAAEKSVKMIEEREGKDKTL